MLRDLLIKKHLVCIQLQYILSETSYTPIPKYAARLARQYRYVSPRKYALIKHNSPSFALSFMLLLRTLCG